MKPSKKKQSPNPYFYKIFALFAFICISGILASFSLREILPPEIPLFYGSPEGQLQLSKSEMIILPLSISLLVLLLNFLLAHITKNNFIKNTLMWISAVTVLFSAITTWKIIFLVGNINIF